MQLACWLEICFICIHRWYEARKNWIPYDAHLRKHAKGWYTQDFEYHPCVGWDRSCRFHSCLKSNSDTCGAKEDAYANKHSICLASYCWFYVIIHAWCCKLKLLILNEMHKPPYAGHPGYQKMITTLTKKFFCPIIKVDLVYYLFKILGCQEVKVEHRHPTSFCAERCSTAQYGRDLVTWCNVM